MAPLADRGCGVWAVCDVGSGDLIGPCGLRYLEEFEETEAFGMRCVRYDIDRAEFDPGAGRFDLAS